MPPCVFRLGAFVGATRKRVIFAGFAVLFIVAALLGVQLSGVVSAGSGNVQSEIESATNTSVAGSTSTVQVSPVPASQNAYTPGQLIVGLAPDIDVDAAREEFAELDFPDVEVLLDAAEGFGAILLVATDDAHAVANGMTEAASSIAGIPGVQFVQPNYRYATASSASELAEDASVAQQYYLDAANIADAWKKTDPTAKVDVAVLDTGVYSMEERQGGALVANNPDNFHQEFDDDNLDMAAGVDFVHSGKDQTLPLVNDYNPTGDDNGHGTHISAIIAANAKLKMANAPDKRADGMAGVSPNARIIPIKVLDGNGDGDVADFIRAYNYLLSDDFCSSHNLRIINMSLSVVVDSEDNGDIGGLHANEAAEGSVEAVEASGSQTGVEGQATESPNAAAGTAATGSAAAGATVPTKLQAAETPDHTVDITTGDTNDEALHQAIRLALNKGIVTVCAAGNIDPVDPTDPDDVPVDGMSETYPSDYEECVSVMALDASGNLASYSFVNPNKDIAAPGSGIYSAWANQADSYTVLDGTSQATAIVSGVLSMMFAAKDGLTVQKAKSALYGQADNGGATRVLDAAAAMERVGAADLAEWKDPKRWHMPEPPADPEEGDDGDDGDEGDEGDEGDDDVKTPTPAPTSISKASVKLAKTSFVYTGKKLTPAVTVAIGGKKLVRNTNYTVAYAANKNPGVAKVTVKGKGAYAGSKTVTFKIALGTAKIKKLKKASGAFTVTWARQKSGNVGYQVRYGLKKSMKGSKVKTVKKNATTKLTVKKLKFNKTYYVQVRTYKKIGKKPYYSAWSAKKAVKTK